jgi:HlyD family secretion protein
MRTSPQPNVDALDSEITPGESMASGRRPSAEVSRSSPAPEGRTKRKRTSWIAVVLAVPLVLGGLAFWWGRGEKPAAAYTTVSASRGTVVKTVTASGSINPVDTIQVGSYVSGIIKEVLCDYNTEVKKGQLCAKIDPRPFEMVVDQDKANLETANSQLEKDEANLAYAKRSYDRNLDLLHQGVVTQDAVDSAKDVYDQALAQIKLDRNIIDQRRASLREAEINLGYTNIVSPVDGTVISRNVTTGQTVAASFQTPTLFIIANSLTEMQVDASISESDIGDVKVGDKASFTVEAFPDHSFDGVVTQVRQSPQYVQNVVTYDAVIRVSNPNLLLKPGMTATSRIVVERRDDVLRVPDDAMRYTPGGLAGVKGESIPSLAGGSPGEGHVWVLRDGRPVPVVVGVGLEGDSYAEIHRGLAVGDKVIVGEPAGATERAGSGSASRPPRLRF